MSTLGGSSYYRNHPRAEMSSTIALRKFLWRNDIMNDDIVVQWNFQQHNLDIDKSISNTSDNVTSQVSRIF